MQQISHKSNLRSGRYYDLRKLLPESSVHLELLQDPVDLALFGILSQPVWKLDHSLDVAGHVLARQNARVHRLDRQQTPRVVRPVE